MKDPKQIVKEGYNHLSSTYRASYALSHSTHYYAWLQGFLPYIPQGSSILELGCADGIPVAEYVSRQYPYLGIDLSPIQIQLAQQNVPQASFQVADMTELSFPSGSFRGIIALYSLIHVPIQQQPALIISMHDWLQADGYILIVVGAGAWTGTEENWLIAGTTMYWSHADMETYIKWFSSAGFTIVNTTFVPEGAAGHTLLIVKK
jgi:cyclopropane fatty-acyl-phospholipid synthase-like methyltransferase